MRIHIYVQHLLGSGHLVRMKSLAVALAGSGHQVTLISGGVASANTTPTPTSLHDDNYELFQLPAIKSAVDDFSVLLDETNAPISSDFKQHRKNQLLQRVAKLAPHAMLVETFPFGRQALRFELLPLMQMLDKMRPRPLRFCSVRDILQTRTYKRYQQTVAEVQDWFDYVLVHADPTVATLDETFPLASQLNDKVFYSGYLYDKSGHTNEARYQGSGQGTNMDALHSGEIIISSGGGAVGFKLLQTALVAKRYSSQKHRIWRILVGRNMPVSQFNELKNSAGEGIVVEWNRADFAALLGTCAVSVSQAGYNTVLDALWANCRSVLVPFAQNGETEQSYRAEKFAKMGRAVVLQEKELQPRPLAAAIERAAALDLSDCQPLRLDGAAATTDFIERCFSHQSCQSRQPRVPAP